MVNFFNLYQKNLLPSQTILSKSPNIEDDYGDTALNYVVRHCNDAPIESLIKTANLIGTGANISHHDYMGHSPLLTAIVNDCNIEMVSLLHRAGGNLTEAAEDSSLYSRLSNEVAKYLINNTPEKIEIFCGSSTAASTFCDKRLFDQSVHKAYVENCLSSAVIKNDNGVLLPANKVFERIFHHEMVRTDIGVKCHYDIDLTQDKLSFLTEYALRFYSDFEENYPGCSEVLGGNVVVVHEGDSC